MCAGLQWFMPVILAIQQLCSEIRRIVVLSQPGQTVMRPYFKKNPSQKRTGGVAQGVGPEFKNQYHKKRIPYSILSIEIE
jgi:hypothetical protein